MAASFHCKGLDCLDCAWHAYCLSGIAPDFHLSSCMRWLHVAILDQFTVFRVPSYQTIPCRHHAPGLAQAVSPGYPNPCPFKGSLWDRSLSDISPNICSPSVGILRAWISRLHSPEVHWSPWHGLNSQRGVTDGHFLKLNSLNDNNPGIN